MTNYEKLIKEYEQHCIKIKQSTSVNINESLKDKQLRIKKLEGDYADWFEYYFPMYAKSKCAWFHKRMAKKIYENKIISYLAEIYRSGAKSVHVDMGIPLYLYVKNELFFMLLIGETDPKAKKLISDIQAQLKYNQRFISDYGKKFKYGDWADGDFTTTDGVKFMSLGLGQSPRGVRELASRPDYIVIDDVDTKERCNNDKRSRLAYEWVWEDLQGTFDEGGERRRFIVANNNFHKNTVINQLKTEFLRINKEARINDELIEHYILTIPAVKDLVSFEPNWVEKTSAAYWKKKYSKYPYRSFMREYMHTHIQDGTIFKADHMQYCNVPRIDSYDGLVVYGDLSYKDNADYKALVLVGKKGRNYYIIDCFVRQTSRHNSAIWLYDLYEDRKLEKYNIKYLIEGLFAQDEFIDDFNTEGDKRGYHIPVVADEKSKANKFDRIESMSGHFERLTVFFNEQLKESLDMNTLVEQLLAFEKGSGAHDDAPDALHSAIAELNKITFVESFEPRVTARSSRSSKHSY